MQSVISSFIFYLENSFKHYLPLATSSFLSHRLPLVTSSLLFHRLFAPYEAHLIAIYI